MIHSGFLALSKRCRRALLISFVAVGLPAIALSQLVLEEEPPEEKEEVRRYTVELIIFEYAESAVLGNENFDHRTTGTLMDGLTVDKAEAAARHLWTRAEGAAA